MQIATFPAKSTSTRDGTRAGDVCPRGIDIAASRKRDTTFVPQAATSLRDKTQGRDVCICLAQSGKLRHDETRVKYLQGWGVQNAG